MKRLRRKKKTQNKSTSQNGSNTSYLNINWATDCEPPAGFPPQEGCDIHGTHECIVGIDPGIDRQNEPFVVATVGDESPGIGSIFDNNCGFISVPSGLSMSYTTGLVDADHSYITTNHTTLSATTHGHPWNDNNIVGVMRRFGETDEEFRIRLGVTPKPKILCAACGNILHHPENFPEDYPEDYKLCCNCQGFLEKLPSMLKRFGKFIGKHEVNEWAENG